MQKNVMKYTVNGKTYQIPVDYINKTRRAYGVSVNEAMMMYLSDEGLIEDPTVVELTAKAKENGAGARGAGRKRKAPTRKPDMVKRSLMETLETAIDELDETRDVEITNVERVLSFSIGDDKYEITLSKKRKPKA